MVDKERKARGWSFERLAEETQKYGKLSSSYIYRLVAGKKNGNYDPTTKTVKVLMEALNLDITDVLKSLGMDQSLKDFYYGGFNQPTDIKELLLQANLIIKTNSGEIRPSKQQKKLIGDFVSDHLYKVALDGEGFGNFSNDAVGYAENLSSLINQEKYVIQLEDGEIHLELNIEVMVEKYEIKKEDILEDVKDIDVKALHDSDTDTTILLFLVGEDWICDRVGTIIVVKDKVSKLRKAYRKK